MHINTKRAGKRNGLKGSVHMAIGILNRVVSAKMYLVIMKELWLELL